MKKLILLTVIVLGMITISCSSPSSRHSATVKQTMSDEMFIQELNKLDSSAIITDQFTSIDLAGYVEYTILVKQNDSIHMFRSTTGLIKKMYGIKHIGDPIK